MKPCFAPVRLDRGQNRQLFGTREVDSVERGQLRLQRRTQVAKDALKPNT